MGMPKADRLLHILNLLRTRKNLNAQRLAEECGVTERSIYRDIMSLSEANVPIYYDRGYKLASDNFLPPLNFSGEEFAALKLALDSSPLVRSSRYRDLLCRVRTKVEAGLSQPVRQERRTHVATTHVDVSTTVNHERMRGLFAKLEGAISEDRCVDIEYDAVSSRRSHRIIEPYFIVFRARAFYLVGWCRLRDDFRTFRLDRILDLTVTDRYFRRRTDISPESYFRGSWEVFSGEPVEVAVRFTGVAARIVELGCHHVGEDVSVDDSDGSCTYVAMVSGTEEIKRWILGFGDEAEVLRPQNLRRELADTSDRLQRIYWKS